MATQPRVAAPSDPLGGLAGLIDLLGGQKSTSSPGDTGPLRETLAALQGTDYSAMLQAIFNKAGGQIPGLQVGLSNAMGARSGTNSAVAATLQKLLQETSTNSMDQVAKLQAQNFSTQAQTGQAIAQATQGTTKKSGANLGKATQSLALLAALNKLGFNKDSVGKLFGGGGTTAAAPSVMPSAPAPAPMMSTQAMPTPMQADDSGSYGDWTREFSSDQYTEQANAMPGDALENLLSITNNFADSPVPEWAPTDEGYTYFADGGLVKAGGSRRSSNPSVTQTSNPGTSVRSGSAFLPSGGEYSGAFDSFGSGGDFTNSAVGGTSMTGGAISRDMAGLLGKANAVNTISGVLGGPAINNLGSVLGPVAGFLAAPDDASRAKAIGIGIANKAAPGLGSAISLAGNPTKANMANFGLSLVGGLPMAAIQAGLSAFGQPSVGQLAANGLQNVDLGTTVNPDGSLIDQAQAGYAINNAVDPMAALITQMGWTPTSGGDGAAMGPGDRGPGGSSGEAGAAAGGAGPGGPGEFAEGGEVDGPGTGTSDSIKAKLSDGEYVMSADTVKALGVKFFDQLQAAFHKPVKA